MHKVNLHLFRESSLSDDEAINALNKNVRALSKETQSDDEVIHIKGTLFFNSIGQDVSKLRDQPLKSRLVECNNMRKTLSAIFVADSSLSMSISSDSSGAEVAPKKEPNP